MHGKEHPQAAGVSDGLQQAKGRRRQSPKAPQVARIFRPDVVEALNTILSERGIRVNPVTTIVTIFPPRFAIF